ncbi:MAG: hypothetical protein LUC43_02210, partial [Burkholderiales bacterium]|nr:hypothetical protein [Burkholderiales bacterium]
IGMGNGDMLVGAHTYTWAVVGYWGVIIFMACMLFLITQRSNLMSQLASPKPQVKKLSFYATCVAVLSFLVVCSNAIQALYLNGLPPNTGKGIPDRFEFDYGKMSKTHTAAVWDRLKHFSLTGKNVIEDPWIKDLSEPEDVSIKPSFINGAVYEAPVLKKVNEIPLALYEIEKRTESPILSVARNEQTGELAFVTNELGVFFTDPKATKVTGFVVFDKPNGADMKYVVGSAYDGNRLFFVSHNKTLAGVQKSDRPIDPVLEFKTFRETTGNFNPVFGKSRKLLQSIRGKHSYINSMATDGKYIYTITLPNRWTQKLVLQKFDMDDWMLSGESLIKPASTLTLKEGRNLDDYYVSGLTYHNGKLLALSPRYSSLLFINPQTAEVEKVYELKGLIAPRSIYVKDGIMYVLDWRDGRNYLVEIPLPNASEMPSSSTNNLYTSEAERKAFLEEEKNDRPAGTLENQNSSEPKEGSVEGTRTEPIEVKTPANPQHSDSAREQEKISRAAEQPEERVSNSNPSTQHGQKQGSEADSMPNEFD